VGKESERDMQPQGVIKISRITALQRDVGKFPQPFSFQLVITGEDREKCLPDIIDTFDL
jgi:hypothetical protein